MLGAALQQLGSEVVGDEAIAACIDARTAAERPLRPEGRERQQGRPPFRLPGQLRRRLRGAGQPDLAAQPGRLLLVHREVAGADLEQRPVDAPAGEGQGGRFASGDRHLRCHGQVGDELGEGVEAGPVRDPMRVVDGEQDRLRSLGHGREQGDRPRPDLDTTGDAIASKMPGSSGSTRSIAAAR